MKKIFSKEYMQDNCGCYRKVPRRMESIFFTGDNTEISIDDILQSRIPLRDKFWFITRNTELTVEQKQHIAISVAEIVLPLYELKYPGDERVRGCIEAAKLFLAGRISIETLTNTKHAAAYAATGAAYAADAAGAAGAAAYAAAYAADAAAYAVNAAAAYAADAAAYAADAAADAAAADYTEKLLNFLTEFVKNN